MPPTHHGAGERSSGHSLYSDGGCGLSTRWIVFILVTLFVLQSFTMAFLVLQMNPADGHGVGPADAFVQHRSAVRKTRQLIWTRASAGDSTVTTITSGDAAANDGMMVVSNDDHDRDQRNDDGLMMAAEPSRLTIFSVLKDLPVWDVAECEEYNREEKDPSAVLPCNLPDLGTWFDVRTTRNAVLSWLLLPKVDVMLFAHPDMCRFVYEQLLPLVSESHRSRLRCEPPPCVHERFNVPQYDCMFERVKEAARTPWVMYTNSDMMYFRELLEVTEEVAQRYPNFAIVGKRTDVWLPLTVSYTNQSWTNVLRETATSFGKLHGRHGIDYFVFPRLHFPQMLPFLVGRVRWDNWLLAQFIKDRDVVTVDATEAILAVHQMHGRQGASAKREGTTHNIDLTRGEAVDPKKVGDIEQTDLRIISLRRLKQQRRDLKMFVEDPDVRLTEPLTHVRTGSCADGQCVLRRVVPSILMTVHRRQHNRQIILATVGPYDVDLALNWACHMDRVGLHHYMFHTAMTDTLQQLLLLDLPAVIYTTVYTAKFLSPKLPNAINNTHVWTSPIHQAQLNGRMEMAGQILMNDVDVLLWDLDAIALGNPLPLIDLSTDMTSRLNTVPVKKGKPGEVALAPLNKNKKALSAGFLFLRSTERVKQYIFRARQQHARLLETVLATLNKNKPYESGSSSLEDQAINTALQTDGSITFKTLPVAVVADHQVFTRKGDLKKGEWPLVIYHDDIDTVRERMAHLEACGLWLLTERTRMCRMSAFQLPIQPPDFEAVQGVLTTALTLNLLVHVSEADSINAIRTLLDGLMQADYTASVRLSRDSRRGIPPSVPTRAGARLSAESPVHVTQSPPPSMSARKQQQLPEIIQPSLTSAKSVGWLTVNLLVTAPIQHRDMTTLRVLMAQLRQNWRIGAVHLDERESENWTDRWLPSLQREMGLFLQPGYVISRHFATALLVLAIPYYFGATEEAFDPHVFGVNLLSQPSDVPFADPKTMLKRVQDTVLYRYQCVVPSGMAVFGAHYAQFLVWHQQMLDEHDDLLAAGKPTTVAGRHARNETLMQQLERYMLERGLYAVVAGPRFGALVKTKTPTLTKKSTTDDRPTSSSHGQSVPVDTAGTDVPTPSKARSTVSDDIDPRTLLSELSSLTLLPLYDFEGNRVIGFQTLEARGPLLEIHESGDVIGSDEPSAKTSINPGTKQPPAAAAIFDSIGTKRSNII